MRERGASGGSAGYLIWTGRLQPHLRARELGYSGGGVAGPGIMTRVRGVSCLCLRPRT